MSRRAEVEAAPRRARASLVLRYVAAGVPLVLLGAIMLNALRDLPMAPHGLGAAVDARMDDTGVTHPVTAVLLNLRAYDTWLEVVALLIAATAVLATRRGPLAAYGDPPGLVVRGLVQRLLPILVLVAVFVLGRGTSGPGGGFQAGALLAAGLYLLHVTAYPVTRSLGNGRLRLLLVSGVATFLTVAFASLLLGVQALEIAPRVATAVIVAIEVPLTISIAVTLAALLIAAEPERDRASERQRRA